MVTSRSLEIAEIAKTFKMLKYYYTHETMEEKNGKLYFGHSLDFIFLLKTLKTFTWHVISKQYQHNRIRFIC